MRISCFISIAVAASLMTGSAFAQVVPDGSTGTSVMLGADGSVSVGIAKASRSGVSLNRYNQFDVPKPGVKLDNRQEAARTIVNEVTGTDRSDINGPLEVVGQRAHVIVANPNGIVLDGARFVNTGRVGLTTGRISLENRQIAPGVFNQEPVATVSAGTIRVGPGGLAGQMDAVDLIAHHLQIDGPITNELDREDAALNLVAGQSRTVFDTAVVPGNLGAVWRQTSSLSDDKDNSVLIEIDRRGVLRSNKIGIEVNSHGAGVRFAGKGYAGSRGFRLHGDGKIVVDGGQINAGAEGLRISGKNLNFQGSKLSAPTIIAQADHTIENHGGRFDTADSKGPGIIQLKSGGSILDRNGQYSSNFFHASGKTNLSFGNTNIRSKAGIFLKAGATIEATDSIIRSAGSLVASAKTLKFSGQKRQSEVIAEGGSLILTSETDLINKGALLQGHVKIDGTKAPDGTKAKGAVTLKIGGNVINHRGKQSSVIFGAAGDVNIHAAKDIDNMRGRILANGAVDLEASGSVKNRVETTDSRQRRPIITQERRKGKRIWWTLGLKRKRHDRLAYDFGAINTDPLQAGQITATGDVRIKAADHLLNYGSQIKSSEGSITLTANNVEIASGGSGRIDLRKTCALTCSYEGSGDVKSLLGSVEAHKDLNIHAPKKVLNDGGVLHAGHDVTIDTPLLDTRSSLVPAIANRPGGLYNFWSSKAAWVFLREQFGGIVADTGKLTVRSSSPVRVQGGTLSGGKGVDLSAGQEIVARPKTPIYNADDIGLLRGISLLKD